MNVLERDCIQHIICNNVNYDIYDEEIDRYFLFYDSNFKNRLGRIPKGSKCSIFVRMSVRSGGRDGDICQKEWEGVAKLSGDMFPHCVLPYRSEEDIKEYFVIKSPNVSLREKQLRLIERMSWHRN